MHAGIRRFRVSLYILLRRRPCRRRGLYSYIQTDSISPRLYGTRVRFPPPSVELKERVHNRDDVLNASPGIPPEQLEFNLVEDPLKGPLIVPRPCALVSPPTSLAGPSDSRRRCLEWRRLLRIDTGAGKGSRSPPRRARTKSRRDMRTRCFTKLRRT